jgi:hypothetical protein
MLGDDAIMRKGGLLFSYETPKDVFVEGARMPLARIIGLECRDIETAMQTRHCTVAKER